MKNHKPWTITAKSNSEIEILLYDVIGQDFFGEGTSAKSFAEDLKAAGDGIRKIHLRVNSPGGNVFDGIAIYNTLLSHGAKVTAAVDGIAASIASVIVMAASEITMNDNAMMMIHNPACMIAGDSNVMRKMAETMDKVKTSMITAYRRHTTKSVEEIGALMDEETWMTAEETVDNGFAEEVNTPEGDAADIAANFGQVFAKFHKVPQQIAARFAGSPPHTKRVDGEILTAECFLYVGDEDQPGSWRLPHKFSSAEKTVTHLRAALAGFDKAGIPAGEKRAAGAALAGLCKEHGITVSDDKSGKALARLLAAAKMCACDCEACMKDDCEACMKDDCEDSACEGCPMQAKATTAAAGDLAIARARIKDLEGKIGDMEGQMERQSAANATAETRRLEAAALQNRWLLRLSGELQQSAALYSASTAELIERVTAAQTLHTDIRGRLGAAGKLVGTLKIERGAEITSLAKWTERVGGELQQAATLYASAIAEITTRSQMQGEMRTRLEAAEGVLSRVKEERHEELKTLAGWTERLSVDLRRSGALHASTAAQIVRRTGDSKSKEISVRLEAAETLVAGLKAKWAAEVKAAGNWLERVTTELKQSGTLHAAALEEIMRPVPAGEIAQKIESVEVIVGQFKSKRAGELKAMERVTADLRQSDTLHRSALDGMARIAPSAETSAGPIEAAEAVLGRLKAERAAEVASLARWTERVSGELAAALKAPLDQSASLLGAVRQELARRTQLASGESAAQFTAHVEQAEKLLLQLKSERTAEGAAVTKAIGELRESSALHASALEETGRRARLAESDTEIETAETILGELKSEDAARDTAGAESAARLRAKLQEFGQLHASAVDEIARRARSTEEGEIGAQLESAGKLMNELKGECAAEVTAIVEWGVLVNGELQESSKLQASALEEITRRARAAESSQELASHLEEAATILGQFKAERAAEVAAVAEWTGRVTKALQDSSKLHASATEEIARRARLTGTAGSHLEGAETLLSELVTPVDVVALDPATTANLKKAGEMYGSAVEEITRRARLATL